MRQSTGIERGAELVLAARNGDPWAREQLVTAHLPLIRTTVALAMSGRGGTEHGDHVEHVVRETMLRALDGLHTVSDPGTFRPWLVAIAVDGIRRHRHAQPAGFAYGDVAVPAAGQHLTGQAYEITTAARWLDPDDGELLALWRLECTGELTRYETAAALRWSVEDTTVRVEALQARFDAARVVAGALSENPSCPFLSREAAGWDGRPSAPWRDHLTQHTLACAHCATRWSGLVPAGFLLTATAPAGSSGASEDERERATPSYAPDSYETIEQPYAAAIGDLTEPYLLAGPPEPGRPHISRHGAATASSAPGRRGSRAALRRRRQTQDRNRRRAVIAAGVVVMAVTGGAFSLHGGRGGNDEILEANRLSAPGPDLPVAHDPSAHSAAPLTASAIPSASPSTSKSAAARPSGTASPTARTTTAPPRPTRTTPPVQVKTTPPRTTAPASPSQSALHRHRHGLEFHRQYRHEHGGGRGNEQRRRCRSAERPGPELGRRPGRGPRQRGARQGGLWPAVGERDPDQGGPGPLRGHGGA